MITMKNKLEFSKKICIFSSILFVTISVVAILLEVLGYDSDIGNYLIPTCGGMVSVSYGFYFNKAKAENLSKQRLRTILIKQVLEGKLSEEDYQEIVEELDNIDNALQEKIEEMYRTSIDEEVDTNPIN